MAVLISFFSEINQSTGTPSKRARLSSTWDSGYFQDTSGIKIHSTHNTQVISSTALRAPCAPITHCIVYPPSTPKRSLRPLMLFSARHTHGAQSAAPSAACAYPTAHPYQCAVVRVDSDGRGARLRADYGCMLQRVSSPSLSSSLLFLVSEGRLFRAFACPGALVRRSPPRVFGQASRVVCGYALSGLRPPVDR